MARTRWFCPTPNCSNGSRAGATRRLESAGNGQPLHFHGQIAALTPHLENGDKELSFTHRFALPGGENHSVADAKFFNHQPPLALVGNTFYPAAQRAAVAGAEISRAKTVRAGAQIEPPPAAASAQDAIESRRGLGAALRRASGRRRNLSSNCSTTPSACGCSRKVCATRASGFGTATNGCANDRANNRGRRQAGNPRRPAAGTGDAMAAQAGLVHARTRFVDRRRERKFPRLARRARGRRARPRRNFSATRRFTACSSRRASSSRSWSSRAAALTGWRFPPNGRRKDSNFPRRIWNGSPPRPAALSNCRTPAGWNSTPPPCRARTRRWPTWAWTASSPCRKKSAWNTSRIWTKTS